MKRNQKKRKKRKKGKKEEVTEVPVAAPVVPETPVPVETPIIQETMEDLSVPLAPPTIPVIPAADNTVAPVEVFNPVIPETPTIEPTTTIIWNLFRLILHSQQILEPVETLTPVEVMEINPTIEENNVPQDISTIMPTDVPLPDINNLQNNTNTTEKYQKKMTYGNSMDSETILFCS